MTTEEKIAMLEDVMDLDEGELTLDSVLSDFEEWDSLSKLSLIAEAKKEFGISIKAEDIKQFQTVKDICDFLND
ncbi:acyl carrier protein [Anaerovibrio slackiae]|uniref:acyl carrier protein n=1 Tax=Anaerovibrio slackiae TaxID=2652309 RepID=UPI003F13C15D